MHVIALAPQVRGPGNAGKSSTIDAMSGKTFAEKASTVGAEMVTCQLERRDVTLGSNEHEHMREYKPTNGAR